MGRFIKLEQLLFIHYKKQCFMNITFDELRELKHALPTGSIQKIANELNIDEQTVRNYFGADHYAEGSIAGINIEPGPHGGIVHIEDTRILELARQIMSETAEEN
ncbi:MAG TPA: DNA-binding protein [Saprospiraceae bacterium]|nr:DNA-binding protein [Saprospiraceae bacterium]HQW55256.1 DNA-binding protein [Saprospiraceae bacterium]